jgi:hypothetical protein
MQCACQCGREIRSYKEWTNNELAEHMLSMKVRDSVDIVVREIYLDEFINRSESHDGELAQQLRAGLKQEGLHATARNQ